MPHKTKATSTEIKSAYKNLLEDSGVKKALNFIESDQSRTIAEQIEITEIPAPPFKEQKRAEHYMKLLKDLNLEKVKMDQEGNVFGVRHGKGNGPTLFVSAHLDTVFPEGTDTTVREEKGILNAPGICDDTRGLAELLGIVRAFNEENIQNIGDVIFGGTVGEEGAGDLRGVKAFFKDRQDIDGFISLDGPYPHKVVYLGTGSYRYKVIYNGPGGHSFGAFGLPSATHALGRAIAKISDLQTHSDPKTTFTVGEIWGGTSVNSIASQAGMNVDLRSNDTDKLNQLNKEFLAVIKDAVDEENERWNSDQITIDIDRFGHRPSASQPHDANIIQVACGSIHSLGMNPQLADSSSTDSNYPMSIGIPAITLGLGGTSGGAHTLNEWYDPTNGHIGVQNSFLTILGLVGVEHINKPLLS